MTETVHRRPIFSLGPDMSVRRQRFADQFQVGDNGVTLTWRGMRYPLTRRQYQRMLAEFDAESEEVSRRFRNFAISTLLTSLLAIPAWFGLQDWLIQFLPPTLRRLANGFVLLQPAIWAGALAVGVELRLSSMTDAMVKRATDRIDYVPERVGPATNWGEVLIQLVALAVFATILFGFLLR